VILFRPRPASPLYNLFGSLQLGGAFANVVVVGCQCEPE